MSREIKSITHKITPIPVDDLFEPEQWLQAEAKKYDLKYLLAHADDGVIWGYLNEGRCRLSNQGFPAVSPPLRAVTLQQARLFGSQAELLVWQAEAGWQARLVQDGQGEMGLYYDEAQILWGNKRRPESTKTFTLVADGDMGHWHAVPLPSKGAQFSFNKEPYRPFRLHVRHYLTQDETSGRLHVTLSRLLNLTVEEAK